jgi:large subunit ribosomal protein L15
MPLFRRLPKRGFTNINSKHFVTVDVAVLNARFEDGAVITEEAILESGLVKNPRHGIKVLGSGEVTKKLTLKGLMISEGAKNKVEAAGGTVEE